MWLINCRTRLLEAHIDQREARYAILSHTWERDEEIQHADFQNNDFPTADDTHNDFQNPKVAGKKGWQKIAMACQLALDDGCNFVWVDTCCIDKSSSAELTEAINSMFIWYTGSAVCYAYLADYDASDPDAKLSTSRWFTRGWTLQELVAPARVRFYDKSWSLVGTKDELSQQLAVSTGIGQNILLASKQGCLEEVLDQVPIAVKMSWAAKRETTRIEDTAYCLLGIFGVNLPLLYGEGERAFIRLQEEIVKNSNDLSLLAWENDDIDLEPYDLEQCTGVFAQHPRYFQDSGKLTLLNDLKYSPDFIATNKGLKFQSDIYAFGSLYVLPINCVFPDKPRHRLGLYLKHQGANVFARANPYMLYRRDYIKPWAEDSELTSEMSHFFLSMTLKPSAVKSLQTVHRCSVLVPTFIDDEWAFIKAIPKDLWDRSLETYITAGLRDFVGYHQYAPRNSERQRPFLICFGFGYGFAPWVRILPPDKTLLESAERGDWRKVSYLANLTSYTPIKIGDHFNHAWRRTRTRYVHADLMARNLNGESMYLIKIHLELSPQIRLSKSLPQGNNLFPPSPAPSLEGRRKCGRRSWLGC